MRTLPALAATCIVLGLALAWTAGVDDARAQEPTPTPSLSFQGSASPPSGTYVDPPTSFGYSLVVSNVGEAEAGPVIVQIDTIDVTPSLFTSTQGTCNWTYGPDYHGYGTGECDLGELLPAGNAAITLDGDIFWNAYSYDAARASIAVNSTPVSQGFIYPFGTPTPTSDPVGGIAEHPTVDGSNSSAPNGALFGGIALVVGLLAASVMFLAKRGRPESR